MVKGGKNKKGKKKKEEEEPEKVGDGDATETIVPSVVQITEPEVPVVEEEPKYLTEDAIYFYQKAKKGRGRVPPPTPNYDIDYEQTFQPLPEVKVENVDEVPNVRDEGIKFTIAKLGQKLGCNNYEYDLIQFWFLDILTDCLWKGQDILKFDQEQQMIILNWVTAIFKVIADPIRNLSRKSFLKLFKEILFEINVRISHCCETFPTTDLIEEMLGPLVPQAETDDETRQDRGDGEESSEETSSVSTDTSQVSASTLTFLSNEKLVLVPEFDIKEHIKNLKTNNPLSNIFHGYSESSSEDSSCEEESDSCDEEEEYRKLKEHELHNQILDQVSFYKPNFSTPTRFRSSYSGIAGIFEKCKCRLTEKLYNLGLDYLHGDEYHEDYCSMLGVTQTSFVSSTKSASTTNEQTKSESKLILDYLLNSNNHIYPCNVPQKRVTQILELCKLPITEDECLATEEEDIEREWEEALLREWAYFKLMEQRGLDMDDPRIGWLPWLSFLKQENPSFALEYEKECLESTESHHSCQPKKIIMFKILMTIVDFVFEYFYENFHFTLIKLAFRSTPNIITQKLNEQWCTPKVIKQELKRPKAPKVKKEKKKKKKDKSSKKSKKSKKSKGSKKSKKDKKKKKKGKDKKKKKKLTKEEKAELERLRREAELAEEERRRLEENRVFMFPLVDAASEKLFMSIFENWVSQAAKGKKKGKKEKKNKKKKKK